MRSRDRRRLMKQVAQDLWEMDKEQKARPNKLRNMNKRIVEKWYDQYIPEHYDRTESLFGVLQIIETKDGGLDLNFDTESIESVYHHQDADIIYNNIYSLGYHGGSLGQPDVMGFSPQEPSWRIGCGNMWYTTPAPRSFSIEDRLEHDITAYDKEYNNKIRNIENTLKRINGGK